MSEQVPLRRAAPDRPGSQTQSCLPVFGEGVAFASFPVLGLQTCTLHETTREKYSGKEQRPFPEPLTGKKSLPDLERGGCCGPGTPLPRQDVPLLQGPAPQPHMRLPARGLPSPPCPLAVGSGSSRPRPGYVLGAGRRFQAPTHEATRGCCCGFKMLPGTPAFVENPHPRAAFGSVTPTYGILAISPSLQPTGAVQGDGSADRCSEQNC